MDFIEAAKSFFFRKSEHHGCRGITRLSFDPRSD